MNSSPLRSETCANNKQPLFHCQDSPIEISDTLLQGFAQAILIALEILVISDYYFFFFEKPYKYVTVVIVHNEIIL
jgi:hypothetical protein